MRTRCAVTTLAALLLCTATGRTEDHPSGVLTPGEKLTYSVRWSVFRIGTIVMTTGRTADGGIEETMELRSNPDLPFISIQDSLASTLDSSQCWSMSFLQTCRGGEERSETRTTFDSTRRIAVYTVRNLCDGRLLRCDTLHDQGPYVEGPALFMMARQLARFWKSRSVPTMMGGKVMTTDIIFNGEYDETEIDAVDHPIRTRKFEGVAHWKGAAAGMTGDFAGWVSDDTASVPVRAEVGIILGSVVIELERWERPGWVPPPSSTFADRR